MPVSKPQEVHKQLGDIDLVEYSIILVDLNTLITEIKVFYFNRYVAAYLFIIFSTVFIILSNLPGELPLFMGTHHYRAIIYQICFLEQVILPGLHVVNGLMIVN